MQEFFGEIDHPPLKKMVRRKLNDIDKRAWRFSPGGYSKKFYTGRPRPEVQPLTLLYTIFSEKVPLSYTFYWKKAPLSYTFLRMTEYIVKTGSLLVIFFT